VWQEVIVIATDNGIVTMKKSSVSADATDLRALSGLTQNDRIQILLAELASIRAEIVSRTGHGFQLTMIATAIVTWVLKEATPKSPWYLWGGVVVLIVIFGIGAFVNVRDLKRAANRAKDLEHEINSRAGEHLLIWETTSGALTRMSLWRGFVSSIDPLPRRALPPLDSSYLRRDERSERK
jgi:hypothetical protein